MTRPDGYYFIKLKFNKLYGPEHQNLQRQISKWIGNHFQLIGTGRMVGEEEVEEVVGRVIMDSWLSV